MNISSFKTEGKGAAQSEEKALSNYSPVTSQEHISITSKANNLNPPSYTIPHEQINSVTNVTDVSKEESLKANAANDYVVKTIEKLALFFPELTEENKNQIFLLDEEAHVTLGNNKMETLHVSDLTTEASHEAAKEQFFKALHDFYSPEVTALFCSEVEREKPLTPVRAIALQQQLVAFEKTVVDSCQGDFSKYPEQLQKQLATCREVQEIMAHPPEPSAEQFAVIDSLSKYTGLPSTMLYAGLLMGGVLATSAASGGMAVIPSLVHVATTGAFAHGSALSAALSSASHATTMTAAHVTGGLAHSSTAATAAQQGMHEAARRHANHLASQALGKTLEVMAALFGGGLVGSPIGYGIEMASSNEPSPQFGGRNHRGEGGSIAGALLGSSIAVLGTLFGPPALAPMGIGAAIGGVVGGGVAYATDAPVIPSIAIGAGVGAVFSGLSSIFTMPSLIGGPDGYSQGSLNIAGTLMTAGFFGSLGGGSSGATRAITGTAAVISGSLAFGSVCHLLASSLAAGTITVPSGILLSIAEQTATAVGSGSLTYSLGSNSTDRE